MHPVTITEASQITGKSRATIYRFIKSGRLSANASFDGEKTIDVAELIRVFGELKNHPESHMSDTMKHDETQRISRLEEEIAFLRGEILAARERENKLLVLLDRRLIAAPHKAGKGKKKGKKSRKNGQ